MAEINLQWKNTEACYDFYCDCNPDEPQHHDGFLGQVFVCGKGDIEGLEPEEERERVKALKFCGKTWHMPNRMRAFPGLIILEACGHHHNCACRN